MGLLGTAFAVILATIMVRGGFAQTPGGPSASGLPEAPGARAVRARCLACHGDDIIREQRLSMAGWEREVDKMIGWGAGVRPSEKKDLVEYLSGQFGVTPQVHVARAESDQAAATLRSRCLACHDLRLIESQRLTAAGWNSEIDKMIRWGATVTERERDVLRDYLAATFGAPE